MSNYGKGRGVVHLEGGLHLPLGIPSHALDKTVAAYLDDVFPDMKHGKDLGLWDKTDYDIFMTDRKQGYDAIVTLDADFIPIQQQFGIPPKVIWIRTGNVSTRVLADILRSHAGAGYEFCTDSAKQCLYIFR